MFLMEHLCFRGDELSQHITKIFETVFIDRRTGEIILLINHPLFNYFNYSIIFDDDFIFIGEF